MKCPFQMKMTTINKGCKLCVTAASLLLINTIVTMLFYDSSIKEWYWFNKAIQYLSLFLLLFDLYSYKLKSLVNFIYKMAFVCAFSLMIFSIVRMAGFEFTTIAFAFTYLFFLTLVMVSSYYGRRKRGNNSN